MPPSTQLHLHKTTPVPHRRCHRRCRGCRPWPSSAPPGAPRPPPRWRWRRRSGPGRGTASAGQESSHRVWGVWGGARREVLWQGVRHAAMGAACALIAHKQQQLALQRHARSLRNSAAHLGVQRPRSLGVGRGRDAEADVHARELVGVVVDRHQMHRVVARGSDGRELLLRVLKHRKRVASGTARSLRRARPAATTRTHRGVNDDLPGLHGAVSPRAEVVELVPDGDALDLHVDGHLAALDRH